MQPTIEILDRIRKNSRDNKEEIFTRLYRYLLRPDLYYLAYKNLYANKGAGTKGVNDDTADGFSKEKVDRIIQSLADGTYAPNPVRREYIQKKQNSTKKRPLGIPTFTDKLVQEVLRMILESVYEPIFSNNSHGFRPNRSCHTALKSLKREFSGVPWLIEGDIKGCFDNIDHRVLANVINAKIKDARLIQLIWKFLKAGYMEDWQYHATYSGCPQGGIVSPILANIYLNELDKFVEKTAKEFYKSRDRHHTPEYDKVTWQIKKAQKQLKTATGQEKTALLQKIAQLKAVMHKTPCMSKTDKVIKYMEQTSDRVLAYAIELTGTERGKIKGNLYELDYAKHYERVKEKELPADTVKLIYEHGEREIPAGQFFNGNPDYELGKFERFEAVPNDPDALQSLLQEERRSREQLPPGDFKAHIAALRDGLIETEARRIVREMKRHDTPNSPNKTHFMVELSPAFMQLAATKDTDRLFSMLPYKTLAFSKIEGRHGTYALIDKGENRDRKIRKPRPSIRAQLKADKAKTAPKKAAAKTKNHDMEV